jgi:hypothetical protein
MKQGNKVVMGIFDGRSQVETCVDRLKSSGFRSSDISVLMPEMGDAKSFAHEKNTKAPEGATTGTGVGAVLGGTLGWLVGAGVIATIPVLGPFVAAGPIMAALAGAAAGGAVGGITGTLVGFGIPEYEAKRYENFVAKGGILLSAHVDDSDWADKAKHILEECGAHDISVTSESDAKRDEKRTSFGKDASQSSNMSSDMNSDMSSDRSSSSYSEGSEFTEDRDLISPNTRPGTAGISTGVDDVRNPIR